jgi:N,N'-diacetyllegionaminate synthase
MNAMRRIQIGERTVGEQCQPFIVAEVGINHNGELDKAFVMIETAKQAGADAVKFQTFKTEEFVGDRGQLFTYRSQGREITEPMFDMFKRYEFTKEQWLSIKRKCDEEGILFLSTPQNLTDLQLLLELGIPAIKVGSDDFTNLPLLRSYSETGLPMIVSCGMANLAEVYQALHTIGALDGYPTVLLLCTSQYPTPPEDANLAKIGSLRQAFPMIPIGFSDHTQGALASSVAVGLGASFFEKHFTLDHDLPGPDHWFSENPESLGDWVRQIRLSYQLLGNPIVRPTAKEEQMKTLARRSVVALTDIRSGEQLTEARIGLRRPGNGIAPQFFSQVVGRTALADIPQGSLLDWGDFK